MKDELSGIEYEPPTTGDNERDKRRAQLIESIQEVADNWPDQLALYSGMVTQAIAEGWEEMGARSIVLNSILCGNPAFIIANIKTIEESTDDD